MRNNAEKKGLQSLTRGTMPVHARHDKAIQTLLSFALAVFLLLLAASAHAESPKLKFYQLAGSIGPKAKIQSRLLVVDNEIYGTYFYESSRTLIPLRGSIAPDGTATMIESAKDGIPTGTITGRLQDAGLSGSWQSPSGKRSLAFTATAISGEYLYYLPMQDLIAKAGAGDADALYRLGVLFHHGQGGLPYNIKQAWAWYKKAAALNHPPTAYAIARLYEMGHGTNASIADADTWMKRAAEQGYEPAKQRLKIMHEKNNNRSLFDFMLEEERKPKSINFFTAMIEHDPATAERALKRIGTPTAQAYLAYMYYTGKIPAKDGQKKAEAILEGAAIKYYNGNDTQKGLMKLLYGIKYASFAENTKEAVSIPCFLHFKHPAEANSAFTSEHGGWEDSRPFRCTYTGDLDTLPEVKMLAESIFYIQDLINSHCGQPGSIAIGYQASAQIDLIRAAVSPQEFLAQKKYSSSLAEIKNWAKDNKYRNKLYHAIITAYQEAIPAISATYQERFLFQESQATKAAERFLNEKLWILSPDLDIYCEKADHEMAKQKKSKR